ncbi:uncharacterized mitochondrial protein AtMg00810-like [Rutidosis leptorrhynchoides]|uniref:uncharacterized mitochondrial protein AtMg00810-like n=1 Tax=Rutidosis leptorrhynchoides TaxID=125765 RepID=UPI003A9A2B62
MHQPLGFRDPRYPDHVYLLQKSLYGLKQAPKAWFQQFAGYAQRLGFQQSCCDTSLFICRQGTEIQIITSLHMEFAKTDLGLLNYFLRISATSTSTGMFISQAKYALEILERAKMANCHPCQTPADPCSKLTSDCPPILDPTLYHCLAGALQYLTFTRPDLSYAVQQICLFMHDPREPHLLSLKRILRYVKDTLHIGLQLFAFSTTSLVACSDADWARFPTARRSTSGNCVLLDNNLLSWSSKRQLTPSRSSAEAEYRGVANAVAETCWVRNLLRKLHCPLFSATLVYCDNVM